MPKKCGGYAHRDTNGKQKYAQEFVETDAHIAQKQNEHMPRLKESFLIPKSKFPLIYYPK